MAATKKVRLVGGFDRVIPALGVDVAVGDVVEVSADLADSLAEQSDVWVLEPAKAVKSEESK